MNIVIRTAKVEDAAELLDIYSYYVLHTAITYETKVPSLEDFIQRIQDTLREYPYLVAVADGQIAGYIYASRFRARAAYNWSAATSVYLREEYHRMGIGRMLYEKLESILAQQNVCNLYVGAADPIEEDEYLTHNSERFHAALGYKTVAKFHECGSKFGRWYNMIEMEKIIGERSTPPKEFVPFSRLNR